MDFEAIFAASQERVAPRCPAPQVCATPLAAKSARGPPAGGANRRGRGPRELLGGACPMSALEPTPVANARIWALPSLAISGLSRHVPMSVPDRFCGTGKPPRKQPDRALIVGLNPPTGNELLTINRILTKVNMVIRLACRLRPEFRQATFYQEAWRSSSTPGWATLPSPGAPAFRSPRHQRV